MPDMRRPLPPMMHSPRSTEVEAPTLPHSLRRQAEAVVIQAAKELVQRHPEIEDMKSLGDAVRVLKQLGG